MTEPQKALVTALMATGLFALNVYMPVRGIVKAHMRYFTSGPLDFMHPGMSTMTGFIILCAGVFMVVFIPAMVFWQSVSSRRAGLILKRAHGEVQRGMPGMEGLRQRVPTSR